MMNLNIKTVVGPFKQKGFMMVEGSHKTMPERDYFYVRFNDDTCLIVQRDGSTSLPRGPQSIRWHLPQAGRR